MHYNTLLQHLGEERVSGSPVVPPLTQTSLFVFDTVEELWACQGHFDEGPPYAYSRMSNPTLDILEKKIAAIEHAERCRVFGSGMAAISSAIMNSVKAGDHIVAVDTCYGPTQTFFNNYLASKFNITTTYIDGRDPQDFLDATLPNTTLYYLESPGSIIFRLQDLGAVAKIARERGITTICDNSYASPVFQNPLDLGIDIVVHSGTKYLAGHSDLTAGVICSSAERMRSIIEHELQLFGSALAPFPGWLMIRSLRTLGIKMRAHQETGNIIADYLYNNPRVQELFHVGHSSFGQLDLYQSQMRGSTGLLSFLPVFQSEALVKQFINSLNIFQIGVSWGGHESLSVPIYMSPIGWDEPRFVIRLFCGLEHPDDLIADLEQAFNKI